MKCRPGAALALALAAALGATHPVLAATSERPVQALVAAPIPEPIDRAFAGTVELHVDATDVARRIFNVRLRIPVQAAGPTMLLYPRWESTSHGPSLSVSNLAGLSLSADGQPLPWRRHPVDAHAFELDIPAGARALEASYQIIVGADALHPDLVVVPWHRLVLYPAGWYARNLMVRPSATLPPGLAPVSSLDVEAMQAGTIELAPVPLDTLLDSPLHAARHLSRIPLDSAGDAPITLNLMASRAEDLDLPPERKAELGRMLEQVAAVFGPAPFERYEFLARLEDDASTGGAEHRSSSEISLPSNYFRDWPAQLNGRDIIPHELVHAWNGLFRVPADLWTPTPNMPQGGSLLWVYEGQTEFWGRILAARAGLRSRQDTLDQLALDAAEVANRPGRAWRSLSDDVRYPAFMLQRAVPWRDWQRRKDYYREGVLLWLWVDALLRERSDGRQGMDDFARVFFAVPSADAPARTYTFESLCAALDAIAPHDWAGELRAWVDGHEELDTTVGLVRHGWQLAYTDTPTAAFQQQQDEDGVIDLSYSIGLAVNDKGVVRAVNWNGPAFAAGLAPGTRIVSVHGQPFDGERLVAAVRDAQRSPIQLLVEQDGERVERTIPYRGTLRYPHLARVAGRPDTLTPLLAPR
ncbi:M61 family metallopeptidase [Luteimonas chenhongjianii]